MINLFILSSSRYSSTISAAWSIPSLPTDISGERRCSEWAVPFQYTTSDYWSLQFPNSLLAILRAVSLKKTEACSSSSWIHIQCKVLRPFCGMCSLVHLPKSFLLILSWEVTKLHSESFPASNHGATCVVYFPVKLLTEIQAVLPLLLDTLWSSAPSFRPPFSCFLSLGEDNLKCWPWEEAGVKWADFWCWGSWGLQRVSAYKETRALNGANKGDAKFWGSMCMRVDCRAWEKAEHLGTGCTGG